MTTCTVYTVVQQYVLVDYCCFRLTSGASTAVVGPCIVHRNRKRLLQSQSTLREESVEKKYQVFDVIGLLIILVQVNLSSPVERVKSRGILESSVNHNIGAEFSCSLNKNY